MERGAAVDVVQPDVLVFVGGVVELDLPDEQVAFLAFGVGRQRLGGVGFGLVFAAQTVEQVRLFLRDGRGDVAVVAVKAKVDGAGVEAVDAGENLDLLQLERAGGLGLPGGIGEVIEGGGGGELGVLAGVKIEPGKGGHVAADLGFEVERGLGLGLLGHLGAQVAQVDRRAVAVGGAAVLDGGVEVGGGKTEGDGAVVDEGDAVDELDFFRLQVEKRVLQRLGGGRGVPRDRLVGLAVLVDEEVDGGLLDAQQGEPDVRGEAGAGGVLKEADDLDANEDACRRRGRGPRRGLRGRG